MKIARTQERDRAANAELSNSGWEVVRLWDFDLVARPEITSEAVVSADFGLPQRRPRDSLILLRPEIAVHFDWPKPAARQDECRAVAKEANSR